MNRKPTLLLILTLMPGLAILLTFSSTVWSQPQQANGGRTTIWDGVYQDAQASKGQAIYQEYCSACHGPKLTGGANQGAPALAGAAFMENWREDSVEHLFLTIRNTMPRQNTNKILTDDESVDLVAYIFSKNDFPAGAELSTKTIGETWIQLKEGPKDLPNYSQLQVVGCLSQEANNWALANAGQPTRLRNSAEKVSPQEVQLAAAKPLGTGVFRLQNLLMLGSFKPEEHKGHKMLAKGVLIRQAGSVRISLTALEMVSSSCGE